MGVKNMCDIYARMYVHIYYFDFVKVSVVYVPKQ